MPSFTPSSRKNPCPVCDRTRDGDCRILDSGMVLCHTVLNGVPLGKQHPDRPYVYCGHSDDAQGFGKWKHLELCEDRPLKTERIPQTVYFDYQFWDGNPTPAQRYRKDFTDGRPKEVKWCRGGLAGRPQTDVAPFCWFEQFPRAQAGEPLFIVKGELKAKALQDLGLAAVSILGTSDTLIIQLRKLGSNVVLTPDCDLADLEGWYSKLAGQLPDAQHLLCPDAAMNWRTPPQDGGRGVEDWLISSKPDATTVMAAVQPNHWGSVSTDEFIVDANALRTRLDDGLRKIDAIPDVATRSVALHTLQQELGLNERKFTSLVQVLSEAKAPRSTESFDVLMAEDDEDLTALVDDLFPTGLILIAAEGFAGKSNTAYQIAEAVTNGSKFAGQFQCQQARALIIQMDESTIDAKRKFKVLGLQPAQGALTIKWHFSPMMLPELRRWIAKSGAKLVILDSLLTIAGGQISPKDAEFGLLIYRLNQLASELGLTILCLHHVVKAPGGKQRTEITKEDIFGTAYVYNGASEAWGLWQSREDNQPEPVFNLRCLKSRSGLVDLGTTYQFDGNDEDKRLTYRGIANRTITLDQIKSARQRVLALLKAAKGAALDPKFVNERLQLGNVAYARRLCRELYEKPSILVGRKLGAPNGGRPAYLYFWAGALCTAPDEVPINTCVVSAESAESTADFQYLRQAFGTTPDPSEREESEGIERGFRHKKVITRETPEQPAFEVEEFDF